MVEYIARFNVALNKCLDIVNIKAKFSFKKDLWAEIAVQVMNCFPLSLKDYQAVAQRAGSIFKYAAMFKLAKREKKGKKLFFSFVGIGILSFKA